MTWELTGNAGTNPATNFLGTTDGQPLVIQPGIGNVGIGTSMPDGKLSVTGNWDGQHGALTLAGEKPTIRFSGEGLSGNQQWIIHEGANGPGHLEFFNGGTTGDWLRVMALKPGGGVEVIGNWDPQQIALTLIGDKPTIRFLGGADADNQQWIIHEGSNGPGDLEFYNLAATGEWSRVMSLKRGGIVEVTGDIRLSNADCAEDFDVAGAESVEPGTVMVLSEAGGALQQSQKAYDKRVAGVISGAGGYKPGIVLDKQHTKANRVSLALLGKVYCKVDASNEPVEVGDLLTTSDRPGHAMKAIDPLKSFGSIIGKALQPLKDSQGLIPILIALQ